MRIAFVPSAHGFGHAARSCGIIEALRIRRPEIEIEIFTEVPEWFFSDSLGGDFGYHRWRTDIGLVQTDSLSEDIDGTCRLLGEWLPFSETDLHALATRFVELSCDAVVADISPLALASATQAGLPGILIENFTWDWIYRGYRDIRLDGFATQLQAIFENADLRIQTEPCCWRHPKATAVVGPISRRQRSTRAETRTRLGVPPEATLIFVTMGGIEWDFSTLLADRTNLLETLPAHTWLVIAGAGSAAGPRGRVIPLPHQSPVYHPDLVHAADVVVGKLGYSTVAEVYSAGCFFAYVGRPRFAESAVLEAWVRAHIPSAGLSARSFVAGTWLHRVLAMGDSDRDEIARRRGAPPAHDAALAARLIERYTSSRKT